MNRDSSPADCLPEGFDDRPSSVCSPTEFICPEVVADWHTGGDGEPIPDAVRGIEGTDSLGYWPEYKEATVTTARRLRDTDHQQGRNSQYMRVEELGDEATAERAFVVEHPANDDRTNAIERAQSRLATWAFVDALGVSVPRHLWLEESEELIVEGIETTDVKAQTVYGLSHPDWASNLSPSALLDQCSVQLLAGNRDLGQMNVSIDEKGSVHVFDFDRAGIELASPEAAETACSQAKCTAAVLGAIRDEGPLFSKQELLGHTRTLATSLYTEFSDHLEFALAIVERYDAVFAEETSREFAEIFERNVACLSE